MAALCLVSEQCDGLPQGVGLKGDQQLPGAQHHVEGEAGSPTGLVAIPPTHRLRPVTAQPARGVPHTEAGLQTAGLLEGGEGGQGGAGEGGAVQASGKEARPYQGVPSGPVLHWSGGARH